MNDMSENKKTIRVLLVLVCLDRGGVESLLLDLHKRLPGHIRFDYLVQHTGSRDEEAVRLGAQVHVLPPGEQSPTRWAAHIGRLVGEHRYDVVHFCRFAFGGRVLHEAKRRGAVVRISHSHHTMFQERNLLKKILYYPYHCTVNRLLLALYATDIIGVSRKALDFSMGPLSRLRKCRVVLNKIDLDRFIERAGATDRARLCRRYGIPDDAVVIGTFGRLEPVKNHSFLLDVFACLARRDPRYVLFIGGEGECRGEIEERIDRLGLDGRVLLPGQCRNAPELYVHLFDCFVLPSIAEGFPNVVVEAVAAGLGVVYSNRITRDVSRVFPDRTVALPLSASVDHWADAIERTVEKKISFDAGVDVIRQTHMSVEYFVEEMVEIYENAWKAGR